MGVLVGREAPDFNAAAVLGSGEIIEDFNFKKTINGKSLPIPVENIWEEWNKLFKTN